MAGNRMAAWRLALKSGSAVGGSGRQWETVGGSGRQWEAVGGSGRHWAAVGEKTQRLPNPISINIICNSIIPSGFLDDGMFICHCSVGGQSIAH